MQDPNPRPILGHSFRRYYLALLVLLRFFVCFLRRSSRASIACPLGGCALFSTGTHFYSPPGKMQGCSMRRLLEQWGGKKGQCAVQYSRVVRRISARKGNGMRGIRYFTMAHWLQQQARCFDTVVRYHGQISNRVNELRLLPTCPIKHVCLVLEKQNR
jgi:hypothetical protein